MICHSGCGEGDAYSVEVSGVRGSSCCVGGSRCCVGGSRCCVGECRMHREVDKGEDGSRRYVGGVGCVGGY